MIVGNLLSLHYFRLQDKYSRSTHILIEFFFALELYIYAIMVPNQKIPILQKLFLFCKDVWLTFKLFDRETTFQHFHIRHIPPLPIHCRMSKRLISMLTETSFIKTFPISAAEQQKISTTPNGLSNKGSCRTATTTNKEGRNGCFNIEKKKKIIHMAGNLLHHFNFQKEIYEYLH